MESIRSAPGSDQTVTPVESGLLGDIAQDVRYGARRLLREPGFSLVAVLTLSLGIGATIALLSVADSVLLRPLPWTHSDRLVRIEERRGGVRGRTPWTVTNGSYNAWRESATTIEGLAGWMSTTQPLRDVGDPERVVVTAATPTLFSVLDAHPAIGRVFVESDADVGRPGTAILSFGLWQQRFGSDPSIVGRSLQLDDRSYEVIGVMPRDFTFPDRDTRIWVPFRPLPLMSADGRQMRVIVVGAIARLRAGATPAQAAAEGTARARAVRDIKQAALSVFGSRGEVTIAVAPVLQVLTSEVRPALLLSLVAVALLLAAAVANVVSVQLARATAKRHETAIRVAMGASVWRVARLWLTESALLGACAGALGVIVAAAICRLMPLLLPADFPRVDDIVISVHSMMSAVAVTVLVSLICGTVPAWLSRPRKEAGALSEDGIAPVGLTMRTAAARMRTSIMVSQVAIACVLVIGGGLLARSFIALSSADRGYEPANLLTARLTFPHAEQDQRRVQTLEALQERARAVPGVIQVGFGNGLPLVKIGNVFGRIVPSPRNAAMKLQISATWRVVSPEYLDALKLRLTAGRSLLPTDTSESPGVIVVNRSFAREYLGPEPLGQRLQLGLSSQLDWEAVGVVEDARQGDLADPPRPEFFVSYRQVPDGMAFDPMLLIRADGDEAFIANTVRRFVRELDSSVVLDSVMPMEDRIATSLARPRAYAAVLGALAVLALAIAGVGLFGVLAYTTARRAAEIGVRVALGAGPGRIVALVLHQAAVIVGTGLFIGVAATLVLAESLSTVLYGVAARDFVSFACGTVVIAIVSAAACVVPATRAARLDPVRALRLR